VFAAMTEPGPFRLRGFGRLPDVHATPIPVPNTQAGMGGFRAAFLGLAPPLSRDA
jgi:hypothetical protein